MTLNIFPFPHFQILILCAVLVPLISQMLRYYDLHSVVPLGAGDRADKSSTITLMPAHVHSLFRIGLRTERRRGVLLEAHIFKTRQSRLAVLIGLIFFHSICWGLSVSG